MTETPRVEKIIPGLQIFGHCTININRRNSMQTQRKNAIQLFPSQ